MANELFLKINTDSKGNKVSLTSMPIEAANVLTTFLESLLDLANEQENKDGIKISLRNSSVGIALEFPGTESEIHSGIDDVLDGRSPNNQYYKTLKTIQDRIKANGLSYEVSYKVDGVTKDLTEKFKSENFIRKDGARKKKINEVIFFKGYIYQAGGKKNANLHLTVEDEDITVNCTQDQAKRFERILYTDIFVCALKAKAGDKVEYTLLDSYASSESYLLFKNFYESIDNDSLERFDVLYDKIVECVEKNTRQGMGELIKIMRLFNYPKASRGMLRTILVTLKPIKDHEMISDLCKELANILRAGSTHKVI